jgi:hypothetical protein
MNMRKYLTYLMSISIVLIVFSVEAIAQNTTNILPLHTGKSYILDFPVKVTRVVGGDPSAMELNLFKKETDDGTKTGYQLLIAPISEKNTNIIIWTEGGIYVFDVIIDNSSPYTAETIIKVPSDTMKFTIPVVESSGARIQAVNVQPEQDIQDNTFEQNDYTLKYGPYTEETIDSQPVQDISLDEPPAPEEDSSVTLPALEKKPEEDSKLHIPINISDKKPEKTEKRKLEVIDIPLKPQVATNYDVQSSLDERPESLFSGKLIIENNGLKLQIDSVNKVEDSLVIHLSLTNTTNETSYLLWDLTKVSDINGDRLSVRNQNLPPGIIPPGKRVKGDIIAYSRSERKQLPTSGKIFLTLLNTQGEVIVESEIPLREKR